MVRAAAGTELHRPKEWFTPFIEGALVSAVRVMQGLHSVAEPMR